MSFPERRGKCRFARLHPISDRLTKQSPCLPTRATASPVPYDSPSPSLETMPSPPPFPCPYLSAPAPVGYAAHDDAADGLRQVIEGEHQT